MDQILQTFDESITSWIYRPYLDLGPLVPDSPHHLWGLEFGYKSLVEDCEYPRIQSALNQSFRDALIHETGLSKYDVKSPTELALSLRTERWHRICDLIESFPSLSGHAQVRLSWLIGKLCFHDFLVELLPEQTDNQIHGSEEAASLAYLRAYARYRLNLDRETYPYSISEFQRVALKAPPGIARIDAHYQVVAQNVKHANDSAAVEHWQSRHREAIESSREDLDEFTYLLLMSRFHRVGGFLPQMRRDEAGVIREMDLAEQFARSLPRDDEVHRIAADEMLYPVLESRTKEALWLNNLDLALERVRGLLELSPNDPRAWLHLGQVLLECDQIEEALEAYRKAARFAPPGREIALFMAGQCYEALDDLVSACDAYISALHSDPLGIASAERLEEVAVRLGDSQVLRWVRMRLNDLRERQKITPPPRPEPYKNLAPPSDRQADKVVVDRG